MANAFNLTAQINLQGPANLKQVTSGIKKEFASINTNLKIQVDPRAEKSITSTTAKLKAMGVVLSNVNQSAKTLSSTFSQLSSTLNTIKSTTSSTATQMAAVAKNTASVTKNTKEATGAFYALGKSAAYSFKQFAGTAILGSTVYKLTNAIKNSFKNFIDFERQMIRVQQVTNSTSTSMRRLSAEIDKASTYFGVSSKSLAQVAVTLSQAGLAAEEVRGAINALAKTELAPTFENLQKTTEGAIAAMNQFGISARQGAGGGLSELEKALGSINAVAAEFAVESGDIIAAIQRAGGVFASASDGVSTGTQALNEFIAVFTSVRATTRESAETIATGLRTIFTRIQRGSTIEALKELGVSLQDSEGRFIGAYAAAGELSRVLKTIDPRTTQFTGIIEELGGFRQIGKVLPLINKFSEAQKALQVATRGQSSLDAAAAKAQQSLAVQLTQVREEFDSLVRTVSGNAIFNGLIKGVLGLTKSLIGLAKFLSPVLPILGALGAIKLASGISSFAKGFSKAFDTGGGARGAGEGIGTAITGGKDKDDTASVLSAQATSQNTTALQNLTTSVKSLETAIKASDSARPYGFARGGVVPGSGSGDTVPAMLTPGEFVIRKNAVKALGTEKLHKMNKYASGGSVADAQKLYGEDSVGAAVLEPASSNKFITSDNIVSASKADKKDKERLSKIVAGKSYKFNARGLKKDYSDFIDTAIQENTANLIDNLSTNFEAKYGNTPIKAAKINPAQISNFMTSINDGLKGTIYEAFITNIERVGQYATPSTVEDRNAPFDLTNGITQGKDLYQDGLDGINFIDLKATLEAASVASLSKKIGNTLLKDTTLGTGPSTGTSQPNSFEAAILDAFAERKFNRQSVLPFYDPSKDPSEAENADRVIAMVNAAYKKAKDSGFVKNATQFNQKLKTQFQWFEPSEAAGGKQYERWKADRALVGAQSETTGLALGGFVQKFGGGGEVTDVTRRALEGLPTQTLLKIARMGDDPIGLAAAELYQTREDKNSLRSILGSGSHQFARKAKGGYSTDTVPALLTPGEFVINKQAASKIGSAQLNRMNKADKVQGFKKGGPVGFVQRFESGGGVDPLGEQFMRSIEAMEVFVDRANAAGMNMYKYQLVLSKEIAKTTKAIQDAQKIKKIEVKNNASIRGAQITADPTNVAGLQTAYKQFVEELTAIAPEMAGAAKKGAQDLVSGLQKGLSFDTIVSQSESLTAVMSEQITETEALNEAVRKVADNAGLASENLLELVGEKNVSRDLLRQSPGVQSFGKFGQIAPELSSKIAGTNIGKRLTSIGESFSGKGLEDKLGKMLGKFGSKFGSLGTSLGGIINKLGGPATVAGAALTFVGSKLPGIVEMLAGAGAAKSDTAAGVSGGLTGAGTGIALGASLGAFGGAPGVAIGAAVGGIIGALDGAAKAISQVRLDRTLLALSESITKVDDAFKLIESKESFDQASYDKAADSIVDQARQVSKLGQQGSAGVTGFKGWWTRNAPEFLGGRNEEANESFQAEMPKLIANIDRLGAQVYRTMSTDSINDVLDRVNLATSEEEKTRIYADASQGRQEYVRRIGGDNVTADQEQKLSEDYFIEKQLATLSADKRDVERRKIEEDPEAREKNIKAGKELAATESRIALAEQNHVRAARDLQIAMENQIDIYRRVDAYLVKFNTSLNNLATDFDIATDALEGRSEVKTTRRTDEDILSNLSAYSNEEVEAAANRTAQLSGGGEQANKMSNQIRGAKIIQDELPKILSNAGSQSADEIIGTLGDAFEAAGVDFSDAIRTQLQSALKGKLETGRQGASREEIASDPSILGNLSRINEAALKSGIAIQKAYNDAIDKTISITNEMNKAFQEERELLGRSAKTKAESENQLAEVLKQPRTLAQLNAGSDEYARERFSNVVDGNGQLNVQNLLNTINASPERLKTARSDLESAKANFAADSSEENKKALTDAEDSYAALSDQANNARSALEYLANDTTKASNALKKIAEEERRDTAAIDFVTQAMTAGPEELAKMNSELQAYTRLASGQATTGDVNSRDFRERALAGEKMAMSLLPEEERRKAEAKSRIAILERSTGGRKLLDEKQDVLGGKNLRQILEDRASGKTPESEYIQAYQKAVEQQVEASKALASAANNLRETFRQERDATLDQTREIKVIVDLAKGDVTVEPPQVAAPPAGDGVDPRASGGSAPNAGVDLSQDTRNSASTASTAGGVVLGTAGAGAGIYGLMKILPKLQGLTGFFKGGNILGKAGGLLSNLVSGGGGLLSKGGGLLSGLTSSTSGLAAALGPILGKAFSVLELGRGGYVGATTDTEYGIPARVWNTLTGAVTGSADNDSLTGQYFGLSQDGADGIGEAFLNNTAGFFETMARGAAVGAGFGGGVGAVPGAIVAGIGDILKKGVMTAEAVGGIINERQRQGEQRATIGRQQADITEGRAASTPTLAGLPYAEQQRAQEEAYAKMNLAILEQGKNMGMSLDQLRETTGNSRLGGGGATTIEEAISNAQNRLASNQTERMTNRMDESNARTWWDTSDSSRFGDETVSGFDTAVSELLTKLQSERTFTQPTDAMSQAIAAPNISSGALTTVPGVSAQDTNAPIVSLSDTISQLNNNLSTANTGLSNLQRAADQEQIDLTVFTKSVDDFSKSVDNFGGYVQQLAEINIPQEITMVGSHVVDVRISGAAAFEALEARFAKMIKKKIGQKMDKIWNQTQGRAGEPEGFEPDTD